MYKNMNKDELAGIYSALGDPSRLGIVIYLLDKEANVSQIASHVELSQPLVSHHLRLLKDLRILKGTKKGQKVYYSLNDQHIKEIVEIGILHVLHGGTNV
jgi:DNA-binding transcriptional ArsR family regulator